MLSNVKLGDILLLKYQSKMLVEYMISIINLSYKRKLCILRNNHFTIFLSNGEKLEKVWHLGGFDCGVLGG